MSYCIICGDTEENKPEWFQGKWIVSYPNKGWQSLCKPCASETPDKVSRSEFEAAYWVDAGECYADKVSPSIRKEFYEDYLRSSDILETYILGTRSETL